MAKKLVVTVVVPEGAEVKCQEVPGLCEPTMYTSEVCVEEAPAAPGEEPGVEEAAAPCGEPKAEGPCEEAVPCEEAAAPCEESEPEAGAPCGETPAAEAAAPCGEAEAEAEEG